MRVTLRFVCSEVCSLNPQDRVRRELLASHPRVRGPHSHLREQRKQYQIKDQHEQMRVASLLVKWVEQRTQRFLALGLRWTQQQRRQRTCGKDEMTLVR